MTGSKKFWDRIAKRYEKKPVGDEAAYQRKLATTREYFRPSMEVLEIGCGTGSTAIAHAPYVAHIRATDISEKMIEIAKGKATEAGVAVDDATLAAANLAMLDHDAELALAAKLAEWPRLIEAAAQNNEPHRVAFYLYDLAGAFHALWNRGNDLHSLRFVQDDPDVTQAKIALARSVAIVIAAGLGILGVTPAQEMR